MPFSGEFDDVYKLGVKPACEAAGAYAERVDEQIFQESILQRTYNQIGKADIIVAEMTGKNPNVFYETGYAHALGKSVILVTKSADDIPFDLKHYPHIVYSGKVTNLKTELERRVRWEIEHLGAPTSMPESDMRFYLMRTPLLNNPRLEISLTANLHTFYLKFDAHNSAERYIQYASFQVLFVTTERIGDSLHGDLILDVVSPPEGGNIHIYDVNFHILPGAWEKFSIRFDPNPPVGIGDEEQIVLRMLSESGGRDYPFRLAFVKQQE